VRRHGHARAALPTGRLARAFRHARLLLPSARRLAYFGWAGHGNAGDEAIYAANELAFGAWRLVQVPSRPATLRLLDAAAPGPLVRGALVGGGTVIGWRGYRETIEQLIGRRAELPSFVLGAGVQDPVDLPGGDPAALRGELERWARLLRRFDVVTVRGPRSQALLAELGIEAEVVGDPALLVADAPARSPYEPGVLGLNVGAPPRAWGSRDVLVERLASFGRRLTQRGWRIRLVPLWERDLACTREVAERIGAGAEPAPGAPELGASLAAVGACHVFVGLRLHSVVFAAGLSVPSVMLAYAPKCVDFQRSIGALDHTMRTDALDPDVLVEHVEELARNRDRESAALAHRVAAARSELRAAIERIERVLTPAEEAGARAG
jgi:hypothetical protein